MSSTDDDRLQHGLELAYGYLNPRDRTESEVRRLLEQNGVDASVADEALRTLADQGYVDDARFARLFTQDKRGLEAWGSDRIRRTLLQRGIDCELIEDTIRADSPDTELERALELLRRRFPSPPEDRRDRDRALGVMLRKGYDSDVALDALTAYSREAS